MCETNCLDAKIVEGACEDKRVQRVSSATTRRLRHSRKIPYTKHIDMKYHYTRDLVEGGFIVVKHVPASDEQADILTKEYIGKNCRRLRDWPG